MDFLQNARKENTILNQEYKEEKLKKLVLKIVEKDKVEKEINKVGNYFIFFILNDKIIYESRCNMKEFVEKLIGRLENRIKYNELCHKEFPNAKNIQ